MDKFIIRSSVSGVSAGTASATPTAQSANVCVSVSSDLPCDVTASTSKQVSKTSNSNKRSFQKHWKDKYNWILYDGKSDKVFCSICKEVTSDSGPVGKRTKQDEDTMKAFVEVGFSSWNKALERFASHEKSDFHVSCCNKKMSIDKGVNIQSLLSVSKLKDMKSAREALLRMLSSLRFLMVQGLAVRGHTDDNSNYHMLLDLVAEDNADLSSWLKRTKYKWLSHDVVDELGSIMANEVLQNLIERLKQSQYFSIIVDETSDISQHEQVSICFRYVSDGFQINEMFFGFYETESTTAETLFKILMDVLARFSVDMKLCRGITTDGASNMTGAFSGLRAKVKEIEPRAIHVHCLAHSLNLVAQEAMKDVTMVRDYLSVIREMICFIRGSPRRLAIFQSIQAGEDGSGIHAQSIRPFCPTRWCCRISSLKTILDNYKELILFFEEIELQKQDAGTKAKGFLKYLRTFEFFYVTKTLIKILDPIEGLNKFLQNSSLQMQKAMDNVEYVQKLVMKYRSEDDFNEVWNFCLESKDKFDVKSPKLTRPLKAPKRLDDGAPPTVFNDPKDCYRRTYFEVVDTVANCFEVRFSQIAINHFRQIEECLLSKTNDCVYVSEFYKDDFDPERLKLHRNMMLDICKSKDFAVKSTEDLVKFFTLHGNVSELIPEVVKLVKISLTIPVSTCTAERSFSALRRLKTYLRSTMTQAKLNNTSIMHVHKEEARKLNLETVANDFIKRSTVRRNTFYIK